jgi:type IV secretory pathway TraG/TraD family ATPase VirD4
MSLLRNLVAPTPPSAFMERLLGPEPAAGASPYASPFSPHQVQWAFQNMPVRHADKHFFVCGTTGSGKTTLIRLFLQSIAPRLRSGLNEQIVLFDPKGDILPILSGLGFGDESGEVWVMNPFDARSCQWDMAGATRNPALARYLATLLIPEEKNSTAPFFWQAAREIVCAVVNALNEIAGADWTFRDLLCAFDDQRHVSAVCRRHTRSELKARMFFEDEKHSPGVFSTITSKIAQFETVAALWESNPRKRVFSVERFLDKPGILVLGHDDTHKHSIAPLNALVMRALTDEILRRGNHPGPRHWFVLDEFPAMEKAEFIGDLLNRGRSKGASVLLGAQGVEGITEHHGENGFEQIVGNCGNKVFLRAGSPKTAKWMESYFGNVRSTETGSNISHNKDGSTTGESWATQDRPQFNSSFFTSLPYPEPGGAIELVADGPGTGPVVAGRSFDGILACLAPTGDVPGVLLRSHPRSQTLEPWNEQQTEFFCAEAEPPAKPPPKGGRRGTR